ncbi:MAG TPA: LbtU family siderophore porin [Gammaproteobacteria bacterium]
MHIAFRKQQFYTWFSIILIVFTGNLNAAVSEDETARLYTTREEQREAGIKHEITSWLTVSGLAELEWYSEKLELDLLNDNDRYQDTSTSVQIATLIEPVDWAKAEFISEFDSNTDEWSTDEATIAFEHGPWELVMGMQNLPFGVYISHFATGPILEFGEIKDSAVTMAYDHRDMIDVSLSIYRSGARKSGTDDNIDWSAAIEAWPADDISFGISYLSDLADSDERLLSDFNNRYEKRVPALSTYLLWVAENYEVSFEMVSALDTFVELDADRDKPQAWNLEYACFVSNTLDWAIRIEGSNELEDAPESQYGFAVNLRLHKYAVLTLEALQGEFKNGLATNSNDEPYKTINTLATKLSIAF